MNLDEVDVGTLRLQLATPESIVEQLNSPSFVQQVIEHGSDNNSNTGE